MENAYVDIMLQSLEKKVTVLNQIIVTNRRQKGILEDENGTPDDFDETVEEKTRCIEQLEQLDSGFEKLFERTKEELEKNKENYADKIKKMQELIKSITDKSVEIQAQEKRNKDLMTAKFSKVKKKVRTIRKGTNVATKYYKSMSKADYVQPQFMDNKK